MKPITSREQARRPRAWRARRELSIGRAGLDSTCCCWREKRDREMRSNGTFRAPGSSPFSARLPLSLRQKPRWASCGTFQPPTTAPGARRRGRRRKNRNLKKKKKREAGAKEENGLHSVAASFFFFFFSVNLDHNKGRGLDFRRRALLFRLRRSKSLGPFPFFIGSVCIVFFVT